MYTQQLFKPWPFTSEKLLKPRLWVSYAELRLSALIWSHHQPFCTIGELTGMFLAAAPALLTLTIVFHYHRVATRSLESMMHDLADCTFIQPLAVDGDQASNDRGVPFQVPENLPKKFE
jgi:hypothetical protein